MSTMPIPQPGQVFKNYKHICAYLSEPILGGESKTAQLSRWSEQFSFIKDGHKIIVTEFAKPLPRARARWKNVIDPQIVIRLIEAMRGYGINQPSSDLKELILYTSEAFVQLGLCNNSHHKLKDGELNCPINSEVQQEYYNKSYNRMRGVFISALERLQESHIICYFKKYMVLHPARLLPEEEHAEIDLLKGRLLNEMNYPNERAICRTKHRHEFYKLLSILIRTHKKLGYDKVYSVYRIFFTEESIAEINDIFITAQARNELTDKANTESFNMHLRLFNEPPFEELTNLVILRPDNISHLPPDLHL